MPKQIINPSTMAKPAGYSYAVKKRGTPVFISGQVGIDAEGRLVGEGDAAAQTEQVLKNIEMCLAAAGAGPEHLVLWTIYVQQGQSISPALEVGMRWWGNRPNPPANTVIFAPAFMPPDFLIGIEAVAVVPL